MPEVKSRIFQMRTDDEFIKQLDDLRRADPGLPSRAEKLRELVAAEFKRLGIASKTPKR